MGELRELVKDATVQGRSGIDLEELATRLKAIPQEPSVQQVSFFLVSVQPSWGTTNIYFHDIGSLIYFYLIL